jgi:hypothetical protein
LQARIEASTKPALIRWEVPVRIAGRHLLLLQPQQETEPKIIPEYLLHLVLTGRKQANTDTQPHTQTVKV